MTGQELTALQKKYVLHTWGKQKNANPLPVKRAEGIYVYDFDGKRYADMASQLVNVNLGHGFAPIADAIIEQARDYCYLSMAYASEPRARLAEMIINLMPDSMAKIFFTNAGAEANENAIKIARMYTGKFKIFSRYRSYHGSSFGSGNLTGEPRRFALEPGVPGFVKFFDPYIYRDNLPFKTEEEHTQFYLRRLEEQILYEGPENIAAIVLETVTGTNGILIPPKGYMPGVRRLCDKYGILMILDEVMSGWGRTGKMFAFEHFGAVPDMVCFAKGVNCGYVPLGGVIVSRAIADYFDDHVLSCGLTYSGHPLACAAGIASVSYLRDSDILERVQQAGKVLGELLEELKAKHRSVGDVRYIGLFSAVELVKNRLTREPLVPYGRDPDGVMPRLLGELKKRGFITYSHENMILIDPPLIITEQQLREELPKLDEVLCIADELSEE